MSATVVTVEPHEVRHGDRLVGFHRPIDRILSTGNQWHYVAETSVQRSVSHFGSRVQVIRDADDCDPRGLARPMWLVP